MSLFLAVIILLFLGFGGPRPNPQTLPFSTEGCTNLNRTFINQPIDNNELNKICNFFFGFFFFYSFNISIFSYPYLYRISYLWYSPIGFCISFFGGWLFTILLELFNLEGTREIYLDDEKHLINADLFSPPIAKQIRAKNAQFIQNDLKVIKTKNQIFILLIRLFIFFSLYLFKLL